MTGAVQLRLTSEGFSLPLRPETLVGLNQFEVHHVLRVLELADDQIACVEIAVALVREGRYGVGGPGDGSRPPCALPAGERDP